MKGRVYMNLKRRVLSLLLSVSIGMTFIPVMAFAGDGAAEPDTQIAIKIIDDRGIESLKVIRIGDE